MDEPTIPQTATFQLKLPSFEGPLDLLLHLIKKHELNVLDLPIAFVTERYLEFLSLMEELDLDVASEYLLMAATLAHIKSKMLLPQTPANEAFEEQDEGYQEDPRAELIRRLLEYQKYKAAAENLGGRPMAGRDVFPRGMQATEAQGPSELAPIDMYKLLDAFQSILKRVQGRVALEVTAERITIHERMTQLSDFLRGRRTCTFEELFEGARTRYEVVVTFLALLEMTKLRMTRVYQADPKSALHVAYALLDENGELAEDVARAFEGVTADSASPPMAAEDFAATAFEAQSAAAAEEEGADDAWSGDEPLAADGGEDDASWARDEPVAADDDADHDAWVREELADASAELSAADGGDEPRLPAEPDAEESAPHDAWVRENIAAARDDEDPSAELSAADGGDEPPFTADPVETAEPDADEPAPHDAWVREEVAATEAADAFAEPSAADGGEDAAPSFAIEAGEPHASPVSHDAWVRDEPVVADDDAGVTDALTAEADEQPARHDAWSRAELAVADGGDDTAPAPHDAWLRDEPVAADGGEDESDPEVAAPKAEHANADEMAEDESEPMSPNTDEWKP